MVTRYDRWVASTSRILDVLAFIFLIDVFLDWLIRSGPPWWNPTLDTVACIIWLAFVVDYLVRLSLSPHRGVFFRTHLLDLVMVAVPMLRLLRVALVLRKAVNSVSTERIAGSLIGG